jgi:uncharacterized glyoxalase superfamily protein PhnB
MGVPTFTSSVHYQDPKAALAWLERAFGERARAAGAQIVAEPEEQFYGGRVYRVADLEGHRWTFSVHVRNVSRAEAEAALGQPIVAKNWA